MGKKELERIDGVSRFSEAKMDNRGSLQVDHLMKKTKRNHLTMEKKALIHILYVLFVFGMVIAYELLARERMEQWFYYSLRQ